MVLSPRSAAETNTLLGPERQVLIYNGDVQKDLGGIKLTSWGSGEAQAISDGYHYYEGPEVLAVKTQGPYQGVVLRFARPVELASFLAEKQSFLELHVMPAQPKRLKKAAIGPGATTRPGVGGPAGGPGAGPGGAWRGPWRGIAQRWPLPRHAGVWGRRQGAFAHEIATGARYQLELTQGQAGDFPMGRGPGMFGPGGPGTPGQPAGAPQENGFSAHNLRLILYTDKGVMIANEVPLDQGGKGERGWYRVSWPLIRFSPASGAAQLEGVGLFSDEAEAFYLGQVRLLVDRQTVKFTLKASPTITKTNRVIDFSVELSGGRLTRTFPGTSTPPTESSARPSASRRSTSTRSPAITPSLSPLPTVPACNLR